MATQGPLSYNIFYGSKTNKDQASANQQYAIAQALLQQGLTPIDTEHRMAGQLVSKVSPLEGVAKLAQALSGMYGEKQASNNFYDAMIPPSQREGAQPDVQPQPSGSSGDMMPAAPVPQDLPSSAAGVSPSNAQALAAQLGSQQPVSQQPSGDQGYGVSPMAQAMMAGNPLAVSQYGAMLLQNPDTARAGAELLGKFAGPTDLMKNAGDPRFGNSIIQEQSLKANPGQASAMTAAGTALAQNAPVGSLAGLAGMGSPPMQGALPPPPPPSALPPQPVGAAPSMDQVDQAYKDQSPGINISGNAPPTQAAPPSTDPSLNAKQNDAVLKSWEAGQSAKNAETGKATGEAIKGAATIDSRFDNAQELISGARSAAKDASYGMGTELKEDWHNQRNDSTSIANADFKNKMSQLLTQSLPGVVQASGGRIDIPLLNAIKAAENADISLSPSAKDKVLNDLSVALKQQRENAHNQVGNMTGQAPVGQPPAGAKLAPDGNYYLPDPSRPGKYLMVQ